VQKPLGMDSRLLPRVFIVDHSPAVVARLAASIHDIAEVIGSATNARDAMSGIRKGNPQFAVLDIAVDNGVDLLHQIKRHRPAATTIILTHSADKTTRGFCLRMGADYFLDKIAEFGKLREIILAVSRA
jgi:DNA-binding NarL/FixJ family response regulator